MDIGVLLIIPALGALWLGWRGHRPEAPWINVGFSAATAIAAARLILHVAQHGIVQSGDEQFRLDALSAFLVGLTAWVGLTTAWFSRTYVRHEVDMGKLTPSRLRLYHGMYQAFVLTLLLALSTNNLGLLWVAMEAATLTTVLLVSLYRTPASLEAAWKYFILCGVGIAQALFGTILLYFAAEKCLGEGGTALLWSHLNGVRDQLEPTIVSLAFVFLFVGYGTKVGLVPWHNWLPDAHAEGPTPISAVLSGLLLNVALYAVLRTKVLVDGALPHSFAGGLMMAFGLLSVVVAALLLGRQRDVKRFFAYSSIEHMGLMTFAFGMGGAVASFAALLHMTLHALTKSGIFFAVGQVTQQWKTHEMDHIRGVLRASPRLGWGLLAGTLAIAGMPPFGVFASEFLILTTALREQPWAVPLLLLALAVAFAALLRRLQGMVLGPMPADHGAGRAEWLPLLLHFIPVVIMGLYLPGDLEHWYELAAHLLG